jgi:alpha-1,3-rhamnosyl/mannosyltransferase
VSAPIAVAVNLLWMTSGRVGGSEEYLTRQLAGLDPDAGCDPTLYCQPSFAISHPELAARFATVAMPFARDWRPVRILAEHTWLPVRTRHADVVHHGGGTVPAGGRGPVLLTVHDLQYLAHPEYFSRTRLAYLRRMMPASIGRSSVVAVPSAFVRDSVVDAFSFDPERVVVVPHGVPEPAPIDPVRRADTLDRYGVTPGGFVVYPAISHPHKSHRVVVAMLDRLDPALRLVLVGGPGAADDELQREIAASPHRDRVMRTGRITASDRDVLVGAAAALVFPSEYEGFGAPLVEAMALDTPVVCGDAAAVREVAGDAAVVVPERSAEAWAAGVVDAISRRDELIARGRRRRADFTLAVSGAALATAYRRTASA